VWKVYLGTPLLTLEPYGGKENRSPRSPGPRDACGACDDDHAANWWISRTYAAWMWSDATTTDDANAAWISYATTTTDDGTHGPAAAVLRSYAVKKKSKNLLNCPYK